MDEISSAHSAGCYAALAVASPADESLSLNPWLQKEGVPGETLNSHAQRGEAVTRFLTALHVLSGSGWLPPADSASPLPGASGPVR